MEWHNNENSEKMKTMKYLMLGMGCMLMMMMTSCKKDDNESNRTFNVSMTDNPGNYAELNVTVNKVEAQRRRTGADDGEWVTLNADAQSINVLSLTNGRDLALASNTTVDAGTYTKIRLTFADEAELVFNADASVVGLALSSNNSLMLDWNGPQAVEIQINPQVMIGASAEVLIDFDVASSIVRNATSFAINPVIREIEDPETGLQGEVEGNTYASIVVTNGTDSASTAIDAEGAFLVRGLDPGTYDMVIRPSEDERNGATQTSKRMENVTIVDGEIKQMGTISL